MDKWIREDLISSAKDDAAETITYEQAAHWNDINLSDRSQIPKAVRPEGGYFEQALVGFEEEPSFEEIEEAWKLYSETYEAALIRGIKAIQNYSEAPVTEEEWAEQEDAMIEAGELAAREENK